MSRLIVIALVSFIAVVPFLILFNRILDVGNDLAGYLSFIFGWILTPLFLIKYWRVQPDIMVMPIEPDDPIMLASTEQAQKELERFFAGLNAGRYEAYIKFPYEFEHTLEHIWGLAHQVRGETVIASLESAPVDDIPEELHARLPVPIEDIEDWMLVDARGRTQGGYSVLAQAEIYRRDFGKVPKKYIRDLNRFTDFSWKN